MSYMSPFEQDIARMDFLQLSEWLSLCRSIVIRDNYSNEEDFFAALDAFCEDWEYHYEQNKKVYASKKFGMARLFATYKNRVNLKVWFGKERNSIETILFDTYGNIHSNDVILWKPEALEIIEHSVSLDYQNILEVFKPQNKSCYKTLLHEVVSEQAFCNIDIKIRAEKDGKKFSAMTYKEFMAECEKNDTYRITAVANKKKSNYNAALDACGVSSTTYHEFHGERTSQKEFDKKFFINLGFALALPYQSMSRLLIYNGYTFNSEGRVFDEVCRKAFQIGFSREMAIALIDKKNAELAKSPMSFNPVPNLTKISSGKRKTV